MNWLFITVGVGSRDFEEAGLRLSNQVSKSNFFSKVIFLNTTDVNSLVPEINDRAYDSAGNLTQGYGFYSWKSRVARLALKGHFGVFDGVVLVDSGCEFYFSAPSMFKLSEYIAFATAHGVGAFSISTPEILLSKKFLMDQFRESWDITPESQFQSGILFFSGSRALEIVEYWDYIVWNNLKNVDATTEMEVAGFYSHRHDQSVLSLILKDYRVPALAPNPPGDPRTFLNFLRSQSFPFWWCRNRSGRTIIPKWFSIYGRITLMLRMYSSRDSSIQDD